MQQVLTFLDGYKRVIVIVAFLLNAILEQATGHGYGHMLTVLFTALGWGDLAGAGVTTATVAAAGTVLWAVIDGVKKAQAAKAIATLALLVLVPVGYVAAEGLSLHVLTGGIVSLQGTAAPAVEPLVHLDIEADTAKSLHAPRLIVTADLTALPGEVLDVGDPTTFRALEFSVGVAQPLWQQSLNFRLFLTAGFATRLPGNPSPRDRAARFAALGLRFASETAALALGIGPDQRLGRRTPPPVAGVQTSARDPTTSAAPDDPVTEGYQAAVTVTGHLDLVDIGRRGRVTLRGSAVLGLDLSRRWRSLNGGATDVVRLGVAVGL